MTVSFKVVNREPVPVSALDSEVSPDIDYVISRAMAKEVAQRYQTGMEMALDLQDVRNGFLPRSTMGALPPKADAAPSPLDTCGLSTVKFSLPLPSAAAGIKRSVKSSQHSAGWPLWQYAAIVVMAIGILGIGYAMFRQPTPSETSGIAKKEAAALLPPTVPDPNRAPVDSAPGAATPSPNTSEPPKKELDDSLDAVTDRVASTATGKKRAAARNNKTRKADTKMAKLGNGKAPTAIPAASSPQAAFSTLHLRVEHHFPQAQILMWIDDKLTYEHALGGTVKKRLVVFKGVRGFESESFRVNPGNHNVRVRVQSSDKSYDRTANISGDFPEDGERSLRIACDKHELKLLLQ
jgi:hypothetical protein